MQYRNIFKNSLDYPMAKTVFRTYWNEEFFLKNKSIDFVKKYCKSYNCMAKLYNQYNELICEINNKGELSLMP